MESLFLLIPLSILLVFLIGLIFWWATRSGQFDDLQGPAHRILLDDDTPAHPHTHDHQPTHHHHHHDCDDQHDSSGDTCSDSSDSGSSD